MTEDGDKNESEKKRVPTWLKVVTGIVVPIVLALIAFFGVVLEVTIPEMFEYFSSNEEDPEDQDASDKADSSSAPEAPGPALPSVQRFFDEPPPREASRARELPSHLPVDVRIPKRSFEGSGQAFRTETAGQFLALLAVDSSGRSAAHDFRLESVSDGSNIPALRSNRTPPSAKLFVLPDSGWYRLHLAPGASAHGEVVVHLFSPESTRSPNWTLRPDSAIRGTINNAREVVFFSVPVRKNDRLLVLFKVTEFVGLIGAELFGEKGSVASSDLETGGMLQVTADAQGRLVLAVFGDDREAPVPYEVYVKKLPEPVVLKGEEAELGSIDFIGDSKKYLIDAEEGSQWWVDLVCHDGLKSSIQIRDPQARLLKGATCAAESPFFRTDIEANKDGHYFIAIEGIEGSTGTYTLTVRELEGDRR